MKRKCWDCGNVAEHADSVVPHVLCMKCGSQDTRRVREFLPSTHLPQYFRDAPPMVREAADAIANSIVKTLHEVIAECYPDMDRNSREYLDFAGAVMYIAEQKARERG